MPPPPPATTETSSGPTSAAAPSSTLAPVVSIIPPPPDIQPVIDKLEEYMARNGIKFETGVHAKNDQRFEFLQPWHQYNAYYEFKKQFFLQKEGGNSSQVVTATAVAEETQAEPAPESAREVVEESGSEDVTDAGGKGTTGTKKESASSKAISDGKLVKGPHHLMSGIFQ